MKNICCFAGHSKIYGTNELYDKLIIQIEKLITEENVSEFWVGNYGDFDKLCARVLQSLKEKHCIHTRVLPDCPPQLPSDHTSEL